MHQVLSKNLFERDLAGITPELCEARGWEVFSREYPVLDIGFLKDAVVRVRLRLNCENWNEEPPSIEMLSGDGVLLAHVPGNMGGVFNPSQHPIMKRPFICMRGSREYHTHDSHLNDPWSNIRDQGGYRLGEIVAQLWRAWRGANP